MGISHKIDRIFADVSTPNNSTNMGIQHLNRFMRNHCSQCIKQISLYELRKKKIAIDASIYMYRFEGEGGLIEGMYQMVTLLLHYGVIPVFVFDGAPPPEKHEILKQRKEKKIAAETEYNMVKRRLDATEDDEDRSELHDELAALKKKFVRLRPQDIDRVKNLLKLCGITYYDAEGEADVLCAKLAVKKRVWACMSEDMDMFVYGCPRVLRYLSLLNGSAVLYDTKAILEALRLSQKEFKEICIVSGTDYNLELHKSTNLYATFKHFSKFKKSNNHSEFYEWLEEHTNYVSDYCRLCSTYLMFDLGNVDLDLFDCHKIMNGPVNKGELHKFLEEFDFIFLH